VSPRKAAQRAPLWRVSQGGAAMWDAAVRCQCTRGGVERRDGSEQVVGGTRVLGGGPRSGDWAVGGGGWKEAVVLMDH
jgi:hypothetical protein